MATHYAPLSFVVAFGVGLAVGFEGPSQELAVVGAIGATCILSIAALARKWHEWYLHPLVLANAMLLLFFVARPLLLVGGDSRTHFAGAITIERQVLPALFLALLATLALNASAIFDGRPLRLRPDAGVDPAASNYTIYSRWSTILTIVGMCLYLVFILQSFGSVAQGIRYLSQGRQVGDAVIYRGSTGYLYYAPYLLIPASLLAHRALVYRRTMLGVLQFSVPFTILFGLGISRGWRAALVPLIASHAMLWLVVRKPKRRLTTRHLVAGIVLLTVAVGTLNYLREFRRASDAADVSPAEYVAASVTSPVLTYSRILASGDLEMFNALAAEMTIVPSEVPFRPGATVTDVLTRVVPRPLWPTKPPESMDAVADALYPELRSVNRGASAPSLVGSLYADLGHLSTVLGMMGVGVALRHAWQYFLERRSRSDVQLAFAAGWPLTFLLLRGSIVDTLAISLFVIGPIIFLSRTRVITLAGETAA